VPGGRRVGPGPRSGRLSRERSGHHREPCSRRDRGEESRRQHGANRPAPAHAAGARAGRPARGRRCAGAREEHVDRLQPAGHALPRGLRRPRRERGVPPHRRGCSARALSTGQAAPGRPGRHRRRAVRADTQARLPRRGAVRPGRHPPRPWAAGHAGDPGPRCPHRRERTRAGAREDRAFAARRSGPGALHRPRAAGLHAHHDRVRRPASRAAGADTGGGRRLRSRGVQRGLLLPGAAAAQGRRQAGGRTGHVDVSALLRARARAVVAGAARRRRSGLCGPR
jgi:hypothetical protein